MNYCLDAYQMKEADQHTINDIGIPSLKLMENAGEKVFSELINLFEEPKKYNFLVLTGSGNNGGDGFVVAKKLLENNLNVNVFEVYLSKSNDAKINKKLFKKETISDINSLTKLIDENTIIIDAIFGYGLNKEVDKHFIDVINIINKNPKKLVVAIDIASGINSSNGQIMKDALKSDITFCLGEYKLGLFLNDGKDYNKKVCCLDIGISSPEEDHFKYVKILKKEDYKDLFIERKENSNKGTYGKVSLIGGNKNTPGALKLSLLSYASLKLGVGYSQLCFPKSLNNIYNLESPEIIYYPLSSKFNGSIKFNKKELNKILNSKVITIGMGIGISKDVYKIIEYLLKNFEHCLIIDADGLNTLSKYGVDVLKKKRKCDVILTPHIKEFERLSSIKIDEIKKNRVFYSEEFASSFNVYLVLKDNSTLITSPFKEKYLNINGNSSLAKGGSGDILSGILAGTLSLNNDTNLLKGIALASYLLGRASDIAIESNDYNKYSLLGSDVVKYINKSINEIIRG